MATTSTDIPPAVEQQEEVQDDQQQQPQQLVEADTDQSTDADSAFGDGGGQTSERTSIFSDIMKYREENGRRYHGYKDGAYLLPNDEEEQNRLDLHHHIFTMAAKGKLYQAPISHPQRVLDVGTGTGIWAMDFGDSHEEAYVIGTDLSPIQPTWVAPNVEFLIEDAEDEWIGSKYDYIHIRMLSGAIKSWPVLLGKAFDHLNPGGWIEVTEFEVWIHSQNDRMNDAPEIQMWQQGLKTAGAKIGQQMDVAVHLETWITAAGFSNVVASKIPVPNSPWAKDKDMKMLGAYQLMNMLDATSSYGAAHFTRVLGWTKEEYDVLSAKVKSQLKDKRLQLYSDVYTVYAQKPLEA